MLSFVPFSLQAIYEQTFVRPVCRNIEIALFSHVSSISISMVTLCGLQSAGIIALSSSSVGFLGSGISRMIFFSPKGNLNHTTALISIPRYHFGKSEFLIAALRASPKDVENRIISSERRFQFCYPSIICMIAFSHLKSSLLKSSSSHERKSR